MLFKPKNHFSYSFSFHFLILLLFFLSFTFEISTEKNSIYLREIEIVKKSKGECPENFVYSKEYSSCVLKCVPVLPQDYKYENVYRIIQIVCGTLSFICCAIYCIYSVLRYLFSITTKILFTYNFIYKYLFYKVYNFALFYLYKILIYIFFSQNNK